MTETNVCIRNVGNPLHAVNQGPLDENSRTVRFIEANPITLGGDGVDEFTQGSQSCGYRNDLMHEPHLHGVKKRKVVTPVAVCYLPGSQ